MEREILRVGTTYNSETTEESIHLWVKVDTEKETEGRKIRVYGTGYELGKEKQEYLGTALTLGGALVWHIFEVLE